MIKKFFFGLFILLGVCVHNLIANDFVTTGSGIRVKKIAFVNVKVYSITHQMKNPPTSKDTQAIINADVDKRFTLKLLRDVEAEKIANAIKEAFDRNGYTNKANIDTFSSVLTGDIKEGGTITIAYNAGTKTTTCTFAGKTSSVNGVDFMKATWSIWFGKIDQPSLTQDLMSKLP
ncbi:MAG: chalcone isomerase family protein [Leptospiraceae bacterium]|nr:chalcone isomerase family protein [Leptospiraceae bacterium]